MKRFALWVVIGGSVATVVSLAGFMVLLLVYFLGLERNPPLQEWMIAWLTSGSIAFLGIAVFHWSTRNETPR